MGGVLVNQDELRPNAAEDIGRENLAEDFIGLFRLILRRFFGIKVRRDVKTVVKTW